MIFFRTCQARSSVMIGLTYLLRLLPGLNVEKELVRRQTPTLTLAWRMSRMYLRCCVFLGYLE